MDWVEVGIFVGILRSVSFNSEPPTSRRLIVTNPTTSKQASRNIKATITFIDCLSSLE